MREPGRVTTHFLGVFLGMFLGMALFPLYLAMLRPSIKLRVRVRSGKLDTSITECSHRHIPGSAPSTSQCHSAHQHAGQ